MVIGIISGRHSKNNKQTHNKKFTTSAFFSHPIFSSPASEVYKIIAKFTAL